MRKPAEIDLSFCPKRANCQPEPPVPGGDLENDRMASLYKKPVLVTDRKTGKKTKGRSKKWWGRYQLADGSEKRAPLARDKAAAQTMLNELVAREERKAAGMIDPLEEHAKRPLLEHLADYRQHLESKESARTHVQQTESYIKKILAGCSFKTIRHVSASAVATWLSDLRTKGRSARTSNAYLTAVKAFTRWLVRDRRAADDPLAHLSALNVKLDVRRERRTLEPTQISKLIAAARDGEPFRELSGQDRAMLYRLALTSGLRASELASLTKRSFDLDADPPTVAVEAAYSKHRRRDVLPLRADVAELLRVYLRDCGRGPTERLWPGSWSRKASAKMLRQDLEAAEIPYEDEAGRVFDFHSLRHQFISDLARCGVHPKEAQTLARHSTITLTMDRYTHVGIVDLTSALDRLPAIDDDSNANEAAQQIATGTDGPVGGEKKVPVLVPTGAENGAVRLASGTSRTSPDCTERTQTTAKTTRHKNEKSPVEIGALRASRCDSSSLRTKRRAWDSNPQPLAGHLISSQAASQFAYPPGAS
jgi:integrase/recombinase XerD